MPGTETVIPCDRVIIAFGFRPNPADWFGRPAEDDSDTATIQRLVEERFAARSARDFATADQIRDELTALGVTVEDHADGSAWRRTG